MASRVGSSFDESFDARMCIDRDGRSGTFPNARSLRDDSRREAFATIDCGRTDGQSRGIARQRRPAQPSQKEKALPRALLSSVFFSPAATMLRRAAARRLTIPRAWDGRVSVTEP